MREIVPGVLWIANRRSAKDIRGVLSAGVEAVIDLAIEERAINYPREIIYCRIPLLDGEGNATALINMAIDFAGGCLANRIPLLICCGAGISRSPLIAAAALTRLKQKTLEETLAEVASRVPHDISAGLWTDVELVLRGRSLNEG